MGIPSRPPAEAQGLLAELFAHLRAVLQPPHTPFGLPSTSVCCHELACLDPPKKQVSAIQEESLVLPQYDPALPLSTRSAPLRLWGFYYYYCYYYFFAGSIFVCLGDQPAVSPLLKENSV